MTGCIPTYFVPTYYTLGALTAGRSKDLTPVSTFFANHTLVKLADKRHHHMISGSRVLLSVTVLSNRAGSLIPSVPDPLRVLQDRQGNQESRE